jgi:hypothetical protein
VSSLRLISIVCGAVAVGELGIVVVRWQACDRGSDPPPSRTLPPRDARAPSRSGTKRVKFADLADVNFHRQFMRGEAIVPSEWPDGFTYLPVRDALQNATRIVTGRGTIELVDAASTFRGTHELEIRSGNKLSIDYGHGHLDCELPEATDVTLTTLETEPALTELGLVERADGREVHTHWTGTGNVPACRLDVDSSVEEIVTVPVPPPKGLRIMIGRRHPTRVSVNGSDTFTCEDGHHPRVVAFEGVPLDVPHATDDANNWLVVRIPDTAFGVTCTWGQAAVHVPRRGSGDLTCTLDGEVLRCPGK